MTPAKARSPVFGVDVDWLDEELLPDDVPLELESEAESLNASR